MSKSAVRLHRSFPVIDTAEPHFEKMSFARIKKLIDSGVYCTKLVEFSPEVASQCLALNAKNRPLSPSLRATYAETMRRGLWHSANGQSVSFSAAGNLDDGQHRLWGCVDSALPLKIMVVFGNAKGAFASIDRGKKRTDSDTLAVRGVANPTLSASVSRLIWRWRSGSLHDRCKAALTAEIPDLVDEYDPELHEAIAAAGTNKKFRMFGTPTLTVFMWYAFTSTHPDKVEKFFEGVISGTNLTLGDPRLALRTRILSMRNMRGTRNNSVEPMALWIKAWNAYIEGATVKLLVWRYAEPNNEAFPTIL